MPGLIDAATLDRLRQVTTSALPDTASLERPTTGRDSEGGETATYATVGTVACRVSRSGLNRLEAAIAERISSVSIYSVRVAWDADVRMQDRLRWTDAIGGAHVLEVVAPGDTSLQTSKRLLCSEVT